MQPKPSRLGHLVWNVKPGAGGMKTATPQPGSENSNQRPETRTSKISPTCKVQILVFSGPAIPPRSAREPRGAPQSPSGDPQGMQERSEGPPRSPARGHKAGNLNILQRVEGSPGPPSAAPRANVLRMQAPASFFAARRLWPENGAPRKCKLHCGLVFSAPATCEVAPFSG